VKILVLDDSEIMRDVLVKNLLQVGLRKDQVHEARNGVEAIRLLNAETFDLFILDIVMDGVSVLKEVKKVQPQAKVIMCSTFSKSEIVRELIDLGIDDFIVKPFSADKIKETVLRHKMLA
jgi:two-component system, chemotaxis family, chemotaxis protein CheY